MKNKVLLSSLVNTVRSFRETLLDDKHRPGYHFAIPEDNGNPADPNGAFFANGRYHLFYLYSRYSGGSAWGHVSSIDLIHWRWHPDAITATGEKQNCCSGGAFVDEDGTAYIAVSMINKDAGKTGIIIYKSTDRHFDKWERSCDYVVETPTFGITTLSDKNGVSDWVGTQDPSNIWKSKGKYYLLTGNYFVLDRYKNDPDAPKKYLGDWADLFVSEDMKEWKYLHRFYDRDHSNIHTAPHEDSMCACFLPLPDENGNTTEKHILLFISHTNGTQYYIGTYDTDADRFIPEKHGRMNYSSNREVEGSVSYTAPEALIAPDGRLICWGWMPDPPPSKDLSPWRAHYALARELWLNNDGELGMAPIREIDTLCYNELSIEPLTENKQLTLPGSVNGRSCRIRLECNVGKSGKITVRVFDSRDGEEYTDIVYSRSESILSIDATHSTKNGEACTLVCESAPLALARDNKLLLDIYTDNCAVEVFANRKQSVVRTVYPSPSNPCAVTLETGANTQICKCTVHEVMPSNQY